MQNRDKCDQKLKTAKHVLSYKGHILHDEEKTLLEYKIGHNATVRLEA